MGDGRRRTPLTGVFHNTFTIMEKTTTTTNPYVYGYVVYRWVDGKPSAFSKVFDTKKKAEACIKKTTDDATYTIEEQDRRMVNFLRHLNLDDEYLTETYFVNRDNEDLYIQLGGIRIADYGPEFTFEPDPYSLEDYALLVKLQELIMDKVNEVYRHSQFGTRC